MRPKKKTARPLSRYPEPQAEVISPANGILTQGANGAPLQIIYESQEHGVWIYKDNCLAVLDAIAAEYPEGRFDMIFADPPYFLSNGGITCHAGKMVKVDKGDWDKSRGHELNLPGAPARPRPESPASTVSPARRRNPVST